MTIKSHIRTVPHYPKQGIQFRDITTLLKDPAGFRATVDELVLRYQDVKIDKIAGIESRGFILGAPRAYALNKGFIPIRKKGKLPYQTHEQTYDLEYGTATVAVHTDALKPGSRVLLIDDLLATGGTAAAAAALVKRLGAQILEISFLIELGFLNGRQKLKDYPVRSLVVY